MDHACCSTVDFQGRSQHTVSQEPENSDDRAGKRPNRWRFIWCHEHCNKPVCAEWRSALAASAKEVGATLKCLKKASHFVDWAETSGHAPYVLVTDWREVKQSIQSVTQHCPQHRPRLTVVLCGSSKQCVRASQWAESVAGSSGPVHVRLGAPSPKELISDLLPMLGCGKAPQNSLLAEPQPKTVLVPAPPTGAGVTGPGTRVAQCAQVAAGPQWPVADPVIQIWALCGCAAEVERLLHKAAPDFYDD